MKTYISKLIAVSSILSTLALAETQNAVTMSVPVLKPGEAGAFTASDASSDGGSGTMTFSVAGVYKMQMPSTAVTGRYSTVAAGGNIDRVGIGFDSFILFRSFITEGFLTVVSSASNTCPVTSKTYNWIGSRFRAYNASRGAMNAANTNFYAGGTVTYDSSNTGHILSGSKWFDLVGPSLTTATYDYNVLSSACSGTSVKMQSVSGTQAMDQYGTLFFGTNSFVWVSSGGNPYVVTGIPEASLTSMTDINDAVLSGLYTEYVNATTQTKKNIYLVPDSAGSTFTLREATNLDDNSTYSTLGTLTCTNFNSPTTGFCSGTLTLNGVTGTGKAVCLPYLPGYADGNQNTISCAAQHPFTSSRAISIIGMMPSKTKLAISGTTLLATALNTAKSGTYTISNLSGRPVRSLGSAIFNSSGTTSTPEFSITSNTCSSTFPGYGTCSVGVEFTTDAYKTVAETLKISYPDGTGATPNATAVTVGTVGISSIAITPATASFNAGGNQQFTATATYTDNSTQDVSQAVTWSTSAAASATVSSAGLVSFLDSPGATISASLGGVTQTKDITVVTPPPNVTGLTVTPSTSSIALSWTSGGGSTSGYKVKYTTTSTPPADCSSGTSTGTTTSYTASSLLPGNTYSFRVCAVNSGGTEASGVTNTTTLSGHSVFVGGLTSGAIGGLAGADASCQSLATSSSLGGIWKAIMSSSVTAAIEHVKISGAVYNRRTSGGIQSVAADSAAFYSTSHTNSLAYGPTGTAVSEDVWTNTAANGTVKYNTAGTSCVDFTSASGSYTAAIGRPGNTANSLVVSTGTCSAASSYRMYCINGQDYTPNPANGLVASTLTGNQIKLTWNIVSNNSDLFDDTGIRVYRSTDNSTYSLIATTAAHAVTYTDSGLSNGTTYYYKVAPIQTVSAVVYEAAKTAAASTVSRTFFQRIFVSSTTKNGSMTGLSGADAFCQNLADASSLGGTWKAILSSATVDAATRIVNTGPFYNLRPAASGGPQEVTSGALFAGNLTVKVGFYDTGAAVAAGSRVWANSTAAGYIKSTTNAATCTSFTSTSGSGVWVGDPASTNSTNWIMYTSNACNTAIRMYCIDGQ